MPMVLSVAVIICAYLMGSIPTGLLIVKFSKGVDIRRIESGRTGGTNAMRAGGFWIGFTTAVLDLLKSAGSVWLARGLVPGVIWLEIAAPIMAILGHNYSIFMVERGEKGGIRFHGGAGGAPTAGGAIGLWFPSLLFIVPVAAGILYFIGYASVATMSIALTTIVIFAIRAWLGLSPWEYVLYGLIAEAMLIWALRPNIQRLASGTERLVGYRAKRRRNDPGYSTSSSSTSSESS